MTPDQMPRFTPGTLAALWCVCLCAGWVTAAEVTTGDGLTLDFGSGGAVISCRIDGTELLDAGARGGLFVADVADIPAEDVRLGSNLSFERIEAGTPVGWEIGRDWQLDRQTARTGDVSMRVNAHGAYSGSLALEVPVKPNTPYRVALWLRTEGCAPTLYIEQYNAQGQWHRDYPQISVSHGRTNADWFELGRSFTTAFFCRKIRVRCNVWNQTGTAWLDDVSIVCLEDDYMSPQRRADAEVHSTSDGMEHVSELTDRRLRLKTVYQSGQDFITVDGEIQDTSGQDRAVAVSFQLPLSARGWTWYEDIQNEQGIETDVCYGAARLLDGQDPRQRRTIALYPFSAIGDGQAALALAVPMDMPRAFRLGYDSELGYFVNYEFGLTQAARKFPGKATFRFFIYRVDPQWGFRSAAKRYYESYPQFFVKRAEREGALANMLDWEAAQPSNVVVPAFADFNWHRRDLVAANRRELVKLLRYSEFIGWWGWVIGIRPEQAEQKPTPEEAWAYVEELAHHDPPNEVAISMLNCALHDRDGKRRLHWDYVPEWGGYNYLCNPDPEITGIGGRINRFQLTYEREVSEVDIYRLDGMRYDNPVVFATDNFRREHFQWADHPLAFDHISKRPVVPLDFSSFECAKAIADDMRGRGKLVGSNYTPVGFPSDIFRIQLLDVVESETLWTWPTNAKLALQRTLANQKIVCMSAQEAKRDWPSERIEFEMKQAMFYGTFYHLSTKPEIHNRWIPLTARLAKAGWEPVTHAECPALGPMVERFGRFPDRNLHFTLRNEAEEAKPVELIIDAGTLGLRTTPRPTVWLMRDAYTHDPLDVGQEGRRWSVELTVPAKDTAVVRVATRSGAALDHLLLVPCYLQKAANYRTALREAEIPAAYPDYAVLNKWVQGVQSMLVSQDVSSIDAVAQLQLVVAALTVPEVRPETTETTWWSERLAVCVADAQREISAALRELSAD